MAFLGKETCSADPCTQSACKLQESQSVFEQGWLSKPACIISPLRQPVCIVTVWGEARGGEQMTKCFRKTRKMTSLATSPRRKPRLPRAGAHRNGLRDVKEARTGPQVPPESHRLACPIRYIFRKVLVFCGKFWYYSAIIKSQKHLLCGKFCVRMSGTFSRRSGAHTPPNLRSLKKRRNVFRIG